MAQRKKLTQPNFDIGGMGGIADGTFGVAVGIDDGGPQGAAAYGMPSYPHNLHIRAATTSTRPHHHHRRNCHHYQSQCMKSLIILHSQKYTGVLTPTINDRHPSKSQQFLKNQPAVHIMIITIIYFHHEDSLSGSFFYCTPCSYVFLLIGLELQGEE